MHSTHGKKLPIFEIQGLCLTVTHEVCLAASERTHLPGATAYQASDFPPEQFWVISVLNVIFTVFQSYSYFPLLWLKHFLETELQVCPFASGFSEHEVWLESWGLQNCSADLALHHLGQAERAHTLLHSWRWGTVPRSGQRAPVSRIFSNLSGCTHHKPHSRKQSRFWGWLHVHPWTRSLLGMNLRTTRRPSQVPLRNRQQHLASVYRWKSRTWRTFFTVLVSIVPIDSLHT